MQESALYVKEIVGIIKDELELKQIGGKGKSNNKIVQEVSTRLPFFLKETVKDDECIYGADALKHILTCCQRGGALAPSHDKLDFIRPFRWLVATDQEQVFEKATAAGQQSAVAKAKVAKGAKRSLVQVGGSSASIADAYTGGKKAKKDEAHEVAKSMFL